MDLKEMDANHTQLTRYKEDYTYNVFLTTRSMLPSSCADRTRMFVSIKIRWPTKMFESSAPIEGVDRWEDRWKFRSKKDYDQGMWDRSARHFPTGVPYCVTVWDVRVIVKCDKCGWKIYVCVMSYDYECECKWECEGYKEVWVCD